MAYKEISASLDPVAKNGKDNYESPRIDLDYNDINSIKSMLEKFKNNAINDERFIINFYYDATKNYSDYTSIITVYYHTKQPTRIKPGLKIVKDVPFFHLSVEVSDKSLSTFKKIVDSESAKLAEIQYYEQGWYVYAFDENDVLTDKKGQAIDITSKDELTNLSNFISLFMKKINNSEKGHCHLFAEGNPLSDDYFLFKDDDIMKQSSQGGCMVIFLLLSSSFFTLLFLIIS